MSESFAGNIVGVAKHVGYAFPWVANYHYVLIRVPDGGSHPSAGHVTVTVHEVETPTPAQGE